MYCDYELLGVSKHASLRTITKRYRYIAKLVHPDKQRLSPRSGHSKFVQLSDAYQRIKEDFETRKKNAEKKNEEENLAKFKIWWKNEKQKEEHIKRREKERKARLQRIRKERADELDRISKESKKDGSFKYNYCNPRDLKWKNEKQMDKHIKRKEKERKKRLQRTRKQKAYILDRMRKAK